MDTVGRPVGELITSGTPAMVAGLQFPAFNGGNFVHQVSPGTIVLNDLVSLAQLPDLGFTAAAVVVATVVSHPAPGIATCDAGHKSVSVDPGVPHCAVIGRPELEPLKPSEEHLPIRVPNGAAVPAIGEQLYLLPKHICPCVNLFDEAITVRNGNVEGTWRIRARGHELIAA
jgi:D-serine deaminase-like pyridoxal phosphate-dependent protein